MNHKVLILILNWNKRDYVINLLKQIEQINYDNFECLVVDNNSTDNSVSEIRKNFPKIDILENPENLGGTGGYNSGIRYILQNKPCEYIWLIDNDAEITPTTISKLIEVLDKENTIGIAGSRIVDINKKDTTIELGSFIRRDTIGVKPFIRNKTVEQFDFEYIETDYVAICSAAVRCSALNETKLMDERYFIFWDDIDWGLQFKKCGYKVVAVPDSIAFHPSFTERNRGIATDYYYSLRNSLLTYTKNTKPAIRLRIFFNFFRIYSIFIILLLLNRRWILLKFIFSALFDFSFNNWGKCKLKYEKMKTNYINLSELSLKKGKVLIIFDRYDDNGIKILNYLKSNSDNLNIFMLIENDREVLYQNYCQNIISINVKRFRTSLIYNIFLFFRVLKYNFDISIGSSTTPFGYATKKYFIFDHGILMDTGIGISSSYKLLLSVIVGFILSPFMTLFVYLSSFKYKR